MSGPHDHRPDGPPPGTPQPPYRTDAPGYAAHPGPAPSGPLPYSPPGAYPPPPTRPRRSFDRALGAAAVWAGVYVALLVVAVGAPPNGRALGYLVGSASVTGLLTALVVWAIARRRAWPFWGLVLVAAPVFLLFLLLAAAGR